MESSAEEKLWSDSECLVPLRKALFATGATSTAEIAAAIDELIMERITQAVEAMADRAAEKAAVLEAGK